MKKKICFHYNVKFIHEDEPEAIVLLGGSKWVVKGKLSSKNLVKITLLLLVCGLVFTMGPDVKRRRHEIN